MLKILPSLLFFLPLFAHSAEESVAEKESAQPYAVTNKTSTLEQAPAVQENETELFFRQCYAQVPSIIADPNPLPIEQQPINIDAQKLYAVPSRLVYEEDVNLTQGDKNLSADKLTYYLEQERIIAEGNVNFNNGQVTLSADVIERQLADNKTSLYQTDYQFHGRGGRGDAVKVYDNGEGLYELNNSSYSACPPGDNTWSIDSTTLYIDNKADTATAYNAILKIKNVPVFYLPYITYPISDKRKTGLLFPSFEYTSTNGFTVNQPLYLNIAENMDATITPTYMQNRGTLLAAQYRYLFDVGSGTIQTEYLGDDKIREENRYLFHWDHNVNFANNWQFNADYNRVSDEYYFTDISTDYGTRSDNQLLQTANLKYVENNWNSELEVRSFQILDDDNIPHELLPKLAFSAYQPLNYRGLQLDWYSEISKFAHSDSTVYTGTRVHLEPKLSLPLYYNSLFVNTELKYMLSYYQQDISDATKYDDLSETATRYLPSFKIHSGVNFERSFSMGDGEYKQTLVPQIQYLYVPYQDQSAIGIYDSTEMEVDYYGLFRDNRFSGYDRISDANQITFGVSSSFINPQGKKKVRFALGQNYYFTPSQTYVPDYDDDDDNDENTASRSSLIGELDINFENDYFFHTGFAFDSDQGEFTSSNFTLEKRWSTNTFAQLNYRYYANQEDDDWDIKINQLGTKVNWSINSQWTSYASYYYDVDYNHAYESLVGVKYQSCCWAISLSYDRYMDSYYGDEDSIKDDYESEQSLTLNFELTGLGGVGVSSASESLFDYGRPFYLQ
ncbi:MAG: LPS-assembly protein [Psychromonas sp.]|jgi:LPS-assembly protein|uniref:LPS assembly protein LptD n=1 Tax=Psychromonas sp. TaxID=1884585 RepID=UPI0039E3CCCA